MDFSRIFTLFNHLVGVCLNKISQSAFTICIIKPTKHRNAPSQPTHIIHSTSISSQTNSEAKKKVEKKEMKKRRNTRSRRWKWNRIKATRVFFFFFFLLERVKERKKKKNFDSIQTQTQAKCFMFQAIWYYVSLHTPAEKHIFIYFLYMLKALWRLVFLLCFSHSLFFIPCQWTTFRC
jgi:hypothetical protein